ncbi:MAG: NDP-sugar synthase [Anaerolineae bacterium]
MLAVVLAAGRGMRLGRLTDDRPKALMPIAGKPMIARVLDMLEAEGVDRFIVVVHPEDKELLEELTRSSRKTRIWQAYQAERRGMADAVGCAAPLVQRTGAAEFLLASCDNLYPPRHPSNLIVRRREERLDAALTLMWTSQQEVASSAGVVVEDGLVTDIAEKPAANQIPSYGGHLRALSAPSLYALTPLILDYVPRVPLSRRNEREFPHALRLLIADGGRVGGQLVKDRMTLTHPRDLLDINRHFLRAAPEAAVIRPQIPPDATVVPPVRIEAGAQVGARCRIGPEVYLETGCSVQRGAVVRRAVVLRGASVKAQQVVDGSVIA